MQSTITRKLNWHSSLLGGEELAALETALAGFYAGNPKYYANIDFTSDNWVNEEELGYQRIVKLVKDAQSICEIGCGSANILKYNSGIASRYTGLDFSPVQMQMNREIYPGASFIAFEQANVFPVQSSSYELVFAVFVLEHVTRPAEFLNECHRILKPGGKLVILCPDFLGRGRMSSQRAGFSEGTTSQKLKRYRILDALVTFYDNRIRIPVKCKRYRMKADQEALFLINLAPVVFTDSFQPDVDAVYLTYKKEIAGFLANRFAETINGSGIRKYEEKKKLIFLEMEKRIKGS